MRMPSLRGRRSCSGKRMAGGAFLQSASANTCRGPGALSRIDPMRTAPLSAAELAQIPEFVEKWTAIGLSTEPIHRDWAEWALAQFYDVAGLADPWAIWAPCPLSAVMSAVAYSAMKSSGLPQTLDGVLDRVARDALMWPMNSMERSIRQAVGPMVNQALRMHAATASAGSPRHPIDN